MNPYPVYKDSGIEWIGEIPEHWEMRNLKRIISEPLKYGANEPAESIDKDLPRYIRITDFGENGELRDETFKSLSEEKAKDYLLREGDLLLARSGATVGKSFLFRGYRGKACFAGYLIKATFNLDRTDPRFIYYFTKSLYYENWKNSIAIQATIQNIGADKYAYLPFPYVESLPEQRAIATYLDRKTQQIDSLIQKAEQKIALLQEQRAALINQAVTRGLTHLPPAQGGTQGLPLKDSGVEWIGEIPEHWEVKKLKYCFGLKTISLETDLPQVGLEHLESFTGAINYYEVNYEGIGTVFQVNDILFGKLRPYLAKVWKATFEGQAVGDFFVLSPNSIINPSYGHNILLCSSVIELCNSSTFGAKMPRVNWEFMSKISLPVPPIGEQNKVSEYIRIQNGHIHILLSKEQSRINLLKEYRQTLISEVVTGKVCVLDEVPQATAS
ncbi:MAG: restriction endonuclease subunit S [Bacteroidota bacterium]